MPQLKPNRAELERDRTVSGTHELLSDGIEIGLGIHAPRRHLAGLGDDYFHAEPQRPELL